MYTVQALETGLGPYLGLTKTTGVLCNNKRKHKERGGGRGRDLREEGEGGTTYTKREDIISPSSSRALNDELGGGLASTGGEAEVGLASHAHR